MQRAGQKFQGYGGEGICLHGTVRKHVADVAAVSPRLLQSAMYSPSDAQEVSCNVVKAAGVGACLTWPLKRQTEKSRASK